eukprot:ANDGO_05106.mRNA.1 Chaperone protein DnaJ
MSHYETLGLTCECSEEDIKKAYRRLSLQCHPDKNPAASDAWDKIQKAYTVLKDRELREHYDRTGNDTLTPNVPSSLFDDLFQSTRTLFDSWFNRSKDSASSELDVVVPIDVSLAEADAGCVRQLQYSRKIPCSSCDATGAASKESVRYCLSCKGTGKMVMERRLADGVGERFVVQCEQCGGQGSWITEKCKTCMGRKYLKVSRTVNVAIPPGVAQGEQIRFDGQADVRKKTEAERTEQKGALVLSVNVVAGAKEDGVFRRASPDGADVECHVSMKLIDALVGTPVHLESLRGESLHIKPSTSVWHGGKYVLPQFGMTIRRAPSERGNLIVLVRVIMPEHLNAEAKALLRSALGDPLALIRYNWRKGREAANERDSSSVLYAQFIPEP